MAVVFISPKKKQQMFFIGITTTFFLALIFIALLVFLSQPQPVAPELVFNKPKININFDVLDSEQFQNLLPYTQMEMQFTYTAAAKDGKIVNGLISAVSVEEARKILEEMDLTVGDIKEVEIGRENPFTPYYQ